MENARLYQNLAEREGRIRRLVDANIIGIVISDVDGWIHEANDAFLRIVGHDRIDVLSQRMSWADMTPPEWHERDQRLLAELRSSGRLHPFEKEFFRKDGSRVPVLVGVANFEDGGGEGVAFVIDLSERNSAADALRTLQTDLAHANRLATMGQLAASIAHEVNQPIGSARNNAHAALRFLAAEPPNLGEVTEALECVVNDTYRASEIIQGIRGQILKVPPTRTLIALNEAISEVVDLAQGELAKGHVRLQVSLAEDLPLINGDRVQLQQVVLNLVLNAIEAMVGNDEDACVLEIATGVVSGKDVLVAVADSGPGIDAENRERIFESFYTTKETGVGIGLSVCRSIIAAHDGQLWAEANSPRGAILKFSLPALVPVPA
jgi:PAS domain S-box-containing protein